MDEVFASPDELMAGIIRQHPDLRPAGIGRIRRALDEFLRCARAYEDAHAAAVAAIPDPDHLDYAGMMHTVSEAEEAARVADNLVVRDVLDGE